MLLTLPLLACLLISPALGQSIYPPAPMNLVHP